MDTIKISHLKLGCIIALYVLGGVGNLHADTVVTRESGKVSATATFFRIYARMHDGRIPESWEEFAEIAPELRAADSPFAVGKGLSEEYSLLPPGLRAQFPEGVAILIRYQPMPFPDAYKSKLQYQVDPTTLTPDQLEVFNAEMELDRQRDRPIRYFVIQVPSGQLTSGRLYEDEIQAILKETGITIPRPTPYYPKGPDGEYLPLTPEAIAALVRLDLTDTIPPELAAKMQAAGTLPAPRPPRSSGATSPDAASPPTPASTLALITSSPWTGWVALAIVLLAAAFYFHRQCAKRER